MAAYSIDDWGDFDPDFGDDDEYDQYDEDDEYDDDEFDEEDPFVSVGVNDDEFDAFWDTFGDGYDEEYDIYDPF